ncbi:MAG: hypothetical protein GKR93_13185 [Gammaproteobacteria bacterium]|nr:hypothetical protein [Gammaproteobacteria bacterium]
MATNRKNDDDFDDDLDPIDDDIEIDPFLDAMEKQDSKRDNQQTARRAIEAIKERQRLKKLLEDYPDYD